RARSARTRRAHRVSRRPPSEVDRAHCRGPAPARAADARGPQAPRLARESLAGRSTHPARPAAQGRARLSRRSPSCPRRIGPVKPVTVSVVVPRPIEEVYDFLDLLANHESFLDHFLVDWKFSGPPRGVGAKAEARASAPMSQDWTDFEVVEADEPTRIVEEGVGLKGKRRTRGTYRLRSLPDGGTEISFEL